MKIEGEGKRLTVYVGSADTWGGAISRSRSLKNVA